MGRTTRRRLLAAGLATPFIARDASAQQEWPTRSIRWVVAFAAGGAQPGRRRERHRQPAGRDRQPCRRQLGGGRHRRAAGAARRLHLAGRRRFPQMFAVRADFPAKTIQEFIALAKANPGKYSYGTPPAAGMAHVAGEELLRRAGIKLIHAPYRGGFEAARDIGSGSLDALLITTSSIRPPLQNGAARVLAVTSLKRVPTLPDVPTLAESGFPGFDLNDWTGLFAAAGTLQPLIMKMYEACAKAAKIPTVHERLDPTGAELVAARRRISASGSPPSAPCWAS